MQQATTTRKTQPPTHRASAGPPQRYPTHTQPDARHRRMRTRVMGNNSLLRPTTTNTTARRTQRGRQAPRPNRGTKHHIGRTERRTQRARPTQTADRQKGHRGATYTKHEAIVFCASEQALRHVGECSGTPYVQTHMHATHTKLSVGISLVPLSQIDLLSPSEFPGGSEAQA